jgi:periplasmic divalent cation tolerance protein
MKEKFILVETTCSNLSSAKKLTAKLLKQKLAACVHFFEIKSNYFWNGKIVSEKEILVRIKSAKSLFKEIEESIKKLHEYETPQIIATDINKGSGAYFDWMNLNLKKAK